jgi:hypothetical protein
MNKNLKLPANIRYVCVLGNVLVTYNLMLIALAQLSRGGPTDPVEVLKRIPLMPFLPYLLMQS